jgi:hypothetical protein
MCSSLIGCQQEREGGKQGKKKGREDYYFYYYPQPAKEKKKKKNYDMKGLPDFFSLSLSLRLACYVRYRRGLYVCLCV